MQTSSEVKVETKTFYKRDPFFYTPTVKKKRGTKFLQDDRRVNVTKVIQTTVGIEKRRHTLCKNKRPTKILKQKQQLKFIKHDTKLYVHIHTHIYR